MSWHRPTVIAHRGFSSRQPEMTVAAYREAIDWAVANNAELGLECDVHFSADDHLVCLHDLTLDRTSDASGLAIKLSLEQLRRVDFGAWMIPEPSQEQRSIITLAELLAMVADARARGAEVSVVIESKHPNPRGLAVEDRVAGMLADFRWDRPGSPVGVISFSLAALARLGKVLPGLPRTLLVEDDLGPWVSGELPSGVGIVGPDLALVKQDPDFVGRARDHGNEVHVWTVNSPDDIAFCLDLGVTSLTTDYPDRVFAALA